MGKGGVVQLQRHIVVRGCLGDSRDIDREFRVARMTDDMDQPARHRGDHRIRVMFPVARRINRLVKTGDDQIQRIEHRAGTVDFALLIFNIGFDTAQNTHAIDHARPDAHINEVPVVRRVGHVGAVIGNGKQFHAGLLRLSHVVVQRAVSMGAGDGVHMQIYRIHPLLLLIAPDGAGSLIAALTIHPALRRLACLVLGDGAGDVVDSFVDQGYRRIMGRDCDARM